MVAPIGIKLVVEREQVGICEELRIGRVAFSLVDAGEAVKVRSPAGEEFDEVR